MGRQLFFAHISPTGLSVWGLMVYILRSGAFNMVFIRFLYLTHFCLFHLLMIIYWWSGVIHFCRFHIYADDLQIYHSSSVLLVFQRCYDEVDADLKRIYDCAASNGFELNPKKSQVILIQKGVVMFRSLSCLKVRNLRFVLNRNLTPVDHYKAVCQRIYSILRSVKPHARYTPFGVR
jgi:hypothetical protein